MTADLMITLVVLAVTVLLFLSERLRLDLVAMLALLSLALTGVLTPEEALAGFSSSVVLMLAGLFVVGGALFKTGVANRLGGWLARRGGAGRSSLLVAIMGLSALLSAFMSSTGTAAVLLPAIMSVASQTGTSPSVLLMPLAYGCLLGGMLTLIGTPPNLVVQEALTEAGLQGFGFFSFAPMGLLCLVLSVFYMLYVGQRLLPDRQPEQEEQTTTPSELVHEYDLRRHIFRLTLVEKSGMIGSSPVSLKARSEHGVHILGYQPGGRGKIAPVNRDTRFGVGDTLHVHGEVERVRDFARTFDLEMGPALRHYKELVADQGLAELILLPRARLLGTSLRSGRFEERFKVKVVCLRRMGKLLDDFSGVPLRFGDTLLVAGRHHDLALLTEESGFVVVGLPPEVEQGTLRTEKAPLAIGLMVTMLVLMSFKLLPSVLAVLLVAAAAVLFGCLDMEDAYRATSWESILLIAGMLPIATALEKTGGITLVAGMLGDTLGGSGPVVVMMGLFLLTSIFSQFVSNTATTVLVAPVAVQTAAQLGVAPHAFLMAVAVAASTAFVTPVASPVNTLVLTPGKYTFADFVKVGLPLQLLLLAAAALALPRLFPFH